MKFVLIMPITLILGILAGLAIAFWFVYRIGFAKGESYENLKGHT